MFRLFMRSLRNNWGAHRANPVNLFAGTAGMLFNNILFVSGFYVMIFSGKSENAQYIPLFLACQVVSMIAWGGIAFFAGGFHELGNLIESGEFENYLASPRSSLFLAGISRSNVTAFGDVLMGIVGIPLLAYFFDVGLAIRIALAAVISTVAMLATLVTSGTLAFFVVRGAALGELLNFVTLSLSVYPTPAALSGRHRLALYLTPALATAFLPLQAVLDASLEKFVIALVVAFVFLWLSFAFFRSGVKKFKSSNYIFLRS